MSEDDMKEQIKQAIDKEREERTKKIMKQVYRENNEAD